MGQYLVGGLGPDEGLAAFVPAVDEGADGGDEVAGVLDRFLNQMREGDLVATVDGPSVYIGRVTGPPVHVEIPERLSSRRRPVRWLNPEAPVSRDQLTDPTRDQLSGQMTVSSLGAQVAEFTALMDPDVEDGEPAADPDVSTVLDVGSSARSGVRRRGRVAVTHRRG